MKGVFIMEKYLHSISRVYLRDCKRQSYIIECIASKSLYICFPLNYPELSSHLASSFGTSHENQCLALSLTYSLSHALIFDIDVCGTNISREPLLNYFYSVFLDVLKFHLASVLKDFTVILSMREDYSGGMHVLLPEVELTHDDYIFLCNQMKYKCNKRNSEITFRLDCPSSLSLVGFGKPDSVRYIPVQVLFIDTVNDKMECIAMYKPNYFSELPEINVSNEKSYFKRLISIDKKEIFEEELRELMMPCVSSVKPLYRVFYASEIYPDKRDHQQHVVARFTHILNKRQYVICKNDEIAILKDKRDWLKCFYYLKKNAHAITTFKSINNRVLKTWCKRFSSQNFDDTGIFQKFNRLLRSYGSDLKKNSNPLQTLLAYKSEFTESGYYFVPVYNALCNILKKRYPPKIVADRLEQITHFACDSMKFMELGNLTEKTIIYCSLKMEEWESNNITCSIKRQMYTILSKFEDFLRYVTTTDEIEDFIYWIQEHFFPIIKSENIYCWNPFKERWQFISTIHISGVLRTILIHLIWYEMKCIMCEHYWFNLFSQVSINKVLSRVLKNVEDSKPIRLTEVSHINWTNVPEFYVLDQEEFDWSFLKKGCDYF